MSHKDPRILCEQVGYTYEDASQPVLKQVDLQVQPGEFLAVLGHNGSGKSTLAKLLNALYVPTEGRVLVCGMDTADDERVWDIRQKAGMIFQNPDNQLVATVVRQDVAFGLENMGVPQPEMLPRIESALATVHMSEFADREPATLSGGQKQRIAIAGVLAMEPGIIIADEATAMLDPSGRAEVLDTVRMLNRTRGITVVWITHYMEEVIEADRVAVVDHGQVVLSGTPREVFTHVDRLRELHLDVPHMTSLASELRAAGMPIRDDVLNVDELAEEVCGILCPSKSKI